MTQILGQLTSRFASHGVGTAQARGVSTLAALVQREANTLSYIDGFWLTVWFAIAAFALTACISAAPPGPFTPKSD